MLNSQLIKINIQMHVASHHNLYADNLLYKSLYFSLFISTTHTGFHLLNTIIIIYFKCDLSKYKVHNFKR